MISQVSFRAGVSHAYMCTHTAPISPRNLLEMLILKSPATPKLHLSNPCFIKSSMCAWHRHAQKPENRFNTAYGSKLRKAFRKPSSETNRPRLLVTVSENVPIFPNKIWQHVYLKYMIAIRRNHGNREIEYLNAILVSLQ